MDPLATDEDVETQLRRSLTAAEQTLVPDILAKASTLFRREAKQDFTPGEGVFRLKVNGGRVRLAQTPVVAVTSVVDDAGKAVDHVLSGQSLVVSRNGCPLGSDEFVTVDYSYGGRVPDLVRITVAEIAAKVLRVHPAAAAGITNQQRTAGLFQESNTYAAWAVGGATMLSPDDLQLARSFQARGTQVIVCQP